VVAIRFQAGSTDAWNHIEIPDGSNRERVGELQRDRAAETVSGKSPTTEDLAREKLENANAHGLPVKTATDKAVWPNTGHGYTSSRVDGAPVIPELQVNGGVPLRRGAEMWRLNKAGDEVLI